MSITEIADRPGIDTPVGRVLHNTAHWRVCTNRHTTTRGYHWGWIEGPALHICWSNDPGEKFTSTHASAVVNKHEQWLEDQKPKSIKLVEINEQIDRAGSAWAEADKVAKEAASRLQDLIDKRTLISNES